MRVRATIVLALFAISMSFISASPAGATDLRIYVRDRVNAYRFQQLGGAYTPITMSASLNAIASDHMSPRCDDYQGVYGHHPNLQGALSNDGQPANDNPLWIRDYVGDDGYYTTEPSDDHYVDVFITTWNHTSQGSYDMLRATHMGAFVDRCETTLSPFPTHWHPVIYLVFAEY